VSRAQSRARLAAGLNDSPRREICFRLNTSFTPPESSRSLHRGRERRSPRPSRGRNRRSMIHQRARVKLVLTRDAYLPACLVYRLGERSPVLHPSVRTNCDIPAPRLKKAVRDVSVRASRHQGFEPVNVAQPRVRSPFPWAILYPALHHFSFSGFCTMMTRDVQTPEISWRGILNCPEANVLSPAEERELLMELVECRRRILESFPETDRSEWGTSAIETDFQHMVHDLANSETRADHPISRIRPTARRYQEIRSRLAMANVRLVAHVAKRYNDRGVSSADLVQEGFCGLLLAIDRFDTMNQTRLATYAIWWIRHAIQHAVAAGAYPVRLNPKHLHQLAQGQHQSDQTESHERARNERTNPGCSLAIERLLTATRPSISLDAPRGSDGTTSMLDFLTSPHHDDSSADDLHEDVRAMIKALNPREQLVLKLRFGLNGEQRHSLIQVGRILGVSKERVRQIEGRALEKLREEAQQQ
jgi:RNA polymerase primary sigma factor